MTSWTVQLITLLGVALGALASFVSTRLVDRGRWQREERLRWDGRRLDCYSEYSAAMMRFINTGFQLAAGRGLPAAVEPLGVRAGLPALAAAESELSIYWAQLLILGSPQVVAAAQEWRTEAWHLESFARGRDSDPAEFEAASAQRRAARARFYTAVRADLGVLSGDIPPETGARHQ